MFSRLCDKSLSWSHRSVKLDTPNQTDATEMRGSEISLDAHWSFFIWSIIYNGHSLSASTYMSRIKYKQSRWNVIGCGSRRMVGPWMDAARRGFCDIQLYIHIYIEDYEF